MKSRKLSQWQYYTKSNLITIHRAAYQKELGVFYYKTINLVKIFLYFVNTSKGNIKENKWVFYNLYLLQFGSYVFHQGNHWIIFFMHKFFSHFRDKKMKLVVQDSATHDIYCNLANRSFQSLSTMRECGYAPQKFNSDSQHIRNKR